ncbi:MAG: endolytic transglycosylase MltG [Deltaproteobacteria bacterium]|nr:endolytic transglycosylase MltG [Deltaproteobacteria bacterium]
MFKLFRLFLLFCFFVLLAAGICVGYHIREAALYKNPQETVIEIHKGLGPRAIAKKLAAQQIIRHWLDLEVYLRTKKKSHLLKAGEYVFEQGLSLESVVEKMVSGKVRRYKVTIPEGYNLTDVCNLFAQKGLVDRDTCLQLTRRVDWLKDSSAAVTLEGYLFPETYLYEKRTTPEELFKQMTAQFYKKLGEERFIKAKQKGLSVHDLVTFASVVEKETGLGSERPLIAGVFYNRLKIGMLLQSDPTVIYGISNFNGNLTRADLTTDSPYNTYTRPGLPVGPICNPGILSIDAVLNPTTTDYLYFVAKGDGSHYFSRSLAEHNRAVNDYQRSRKKQTEPL